MTRDELITYIDMLSVQAKTIIESGQEHGFMLHVHKHDGAVELLLFVEGASLEGRKMIRTATMMYASGGADALFMISEAWTVTANRHETDAVARLQHVARQRKIHTLAEKKEVLLIAGASKHGVVTRAWDITTDGKRRRVEGVRAQTCSDDEVKVNYYLDDLPWRAA